ncbi:hypothetical protein ACROYT_G022267 [Oculina patagonica]
MSGEVEENAQIFLSFSNLGVKIADRQILENVSGKVHPGEMLAVMGPSGSGKTTLLNVLAGRLSPEDGEILLNGTKLNKKLKKKICYVLQEDIFFGNLTLRETLTFSAMLRLPDTLSKTEKLQKVDKIVDNLDVRKCLDTKIGSAFDRGLSGGEKKRANIGCELITNPSLIFLDEPTSGLDSSNALNLVKTLKNFAAREKKTVVTTIHQPSSQIFYMFDKVLLLCGGQVAYYGKASKVLDFFEGIGLVCDAHFNPADFILEKVTEGEEVQGKIVKGWTERQKRHKKYSAMSTEYTPATLETPSPTAKNNERHELENTQDTASERSSKTSDNSADQGNVEQEDGQPTATEDPLCKEEESSGYSSLDVGDGNSIAPDKEVEKESLESSILDSNGVPKERGSSVNDEKEVADENDSTNPLIAHQKLSAPKTLWKSVRNSFTKSSDSLPPVHTEAQLSSADFSVAVVTYKRSTSRDYSKVDIHDDDDDEDQSALYSDISTSWATSFWTQFTVLLQRTFKQSLPDILSKLELIQNLLLALIVSVVWFQLPYKEESIVDRYSLMFFFVVHCNFASLFQALMSFPNERTVVNKERAAGYYRLSAYYLAKLFSELPLVMIQPTLFLIIVYWVTGLNRSEAFLAQLFLLLLTAITGQSVGLCIGATVMDFKQSIVVAIIFGLSGMLLGGFYQQNLPPWLAWLQYTSYLAYSYDAALGIEFANSPTFSCREVDSSYAACRNNGTAITGSEILEKLNVSRSVGENVAALLLFIIVFRILTYLSLRYLHKPK